jgi:hypothetical protein
MNKIQELKLFQRHEEEAGLLSIPYIELYSLLISDEAYKREISENDGAHPKRKCYSKIANIIGSSPSWWINDP